MSLERLVTALSPSPLRRQETIAGWLMALPGVLLLCVFVAIPFLLAVGLSFTDLRLGAPTGPGFVGGEQYRDLLHDAAFRRAVLNTVLFAVVVVPVQTALALFLALMLNTRMRGMSVYRSLFFMPVVFPMSLIAVVWELMYAPGPNGMVNAFVQTLSLGYLGPYDYLHNPWLALPALIVLSVWQGLGFQMVVLLAGLQAIPEVLYECAALETNRRWHTFRHITLPQLRNPLIFTCLVTTILAFRVFDQVQILTQGQPNNATTTIMYEAVRTAWNLSKVGQASAMTVVFFLLVLGITAMQRFLFRQEREVQ